MDDDEDDLNHSDSIQSQSTLEQQDDQKIISTTDPTFSKEKEKLSSNRRRVRVKFAYSFDDERVLPITQTTVIKTEPYFKVIATEDQATKQFYQNKSKKQETAPLIEADSLDEEYPSQFNKEKEESPKISNFEQTVIQPLKSILKKPKKKEQEEKTSIPKIDESIKSRSHSLSSKKKEISSTRLDFNEVQHLAEITAKQNPPSPSIHTRSLFDQTINIFDPNNSYRITSSTPRPSRLQYYIKPYRGDPKDLKNLNKQRSQTTNRWHTFSNQYVQPLIRQSNRKQHVSWPPARDYNHQERDYTITAPTREERTSSSLSLSNPCLQNLPPILPVSVHHRFPVHSLSTDSYYTPSVIDRPLTLLTYKSKEEGDEKTMLRSHLSDQHKKEHDETMKRYDRLLEKIRTTDEQLQSLSRSWTNNIQQSTSVRADRRSSLTLNKVTNDSDLFSPMIVQICLIILVIFNLLVVYFFNEINVWWSENIAPGMIVERHHEAFLNF